MNLTSSAPGPQETGGNFLGDRRVVADLSALANCALLDEAGRTKPTADLWQKRPAVLVFLRHFARESCRMHALELWGHKASFDSRNVGLHFIGNGAPHALAAFKAEHRMDKASFFTDPTLSAFKAAGFRRGFWIDPGEMHSRGEFLWLAVRHQMRRSGSGNVWQLGGVLAVNPDGRATYQFTSLSMSDFPPSRDLSQIG